MNSLVPPLQPFVAQGENQGEKWEQWRKSFTYYAAAVGVNNQEQRKNLLLHVAGQDLQKIFETLSFGTDANGAPIVPNYEQVVAKLNEYFTPKRNVTFERHVFRKAAQSADETTDDYVMRLRQLVLYCEYGDKTDEFLKDQFIDSCYNSRLRVRLLRQPDLKLPDVIAAARLAELSAR